MKKIIQRLFAAGKKDLTKNDLNTINDTLDYYLGKIPSTFLYKEKKYTPLSFAKQYVHFNVNDYVELVSFDDKIYYKQFMLQDKYNWANDSFYNIRLADFEMIVDTAIAKGYTVGWEGDVTENGFNYLNGIAYYDGPVPAIDSLRIVNYKDESTERDHMLHLTGVGKDDDNNKWYYLKNSWGATNTLSGFMYMQLGYFRLKTVILVLNKKALPEDIKTKLK
jgi:bleomycin hydrolase